jgi:hypothetical protein
MDVREILLERVWAGTRTSRRRTAVASTPDDTANAMNSLRGGELGEAR